MADHYLHIAVGVVKDDCGRILISERKQDCVYAGQWEFPGGKVEAGESVEQALARELHEELGLSITGARPLIALRHIYPDRKVFLDTWIVTDWSGAPESREGQRFDWLRPEELDDYPMLQANRPIVRATQLPCEYLITPVCEEETIFLSSLEARLAAGVRLVRLRQPGLSRRDYERLAIECKLLCEQFSAALMLDDLETSISLGVGWHMNSLQLSTQNERMLPESVYQAASCHHYEELEKAMALGCDFAVLGPVKKTASHPDGQVIGWDGFSKLVSEATLPVYALGGLKRVDVEQSWHSGGQGVAAIRGLWQPE